MDRPIEITKPDNSLIAYSYNKAGLLETVKARLRGSTSWTDFVTNINYNEKGQRTEVYFANDHEQNVLRSQFATLKRNKGKWISTDNKKSGKEMPGNVHQIHILPQFVHDDLGLLLFLHG